MMKGRPVDRHPPLASYSPEVARLDRLIDAVNANTAATVAAAGAKKVPKVEPQPRPETAFARIAHRAREAQHQKTVEFVLGKDRRRRGINRLMTGRVGQDQDDTPGR